MSWTALCNPTSVNWNLRVLQRAILVLEKSCYLNSNNYSSYNKSKMKGLILGVYTEQKDHFNEVSSFTPTFKEINDRSNGQLAAALKSTGPFYKPAKHKLLWLSMLKDLKIDGDYSCLSVVDLGSEDVKEDKLECLDMKSENIRCAIADGVKSLRACSQFEDIYLDACDSPQSVAEAAALTLYSYDELKQKSSRKPKSQLHLYKSSSVVEESLVLFKRGLLFAESQNFARTLTETPANLMTPTIFSKTVAEKFKEVASVEVIIRDEDWIKSKKMGAFLSVTKGSDEPPKFLEIHYNGNPDYDKSIALVGKGITFDSGGISLKPSSNMDKMRGDMGGAACVVAAIWAASALNLKVNLKGFIPLCENLPSGKASKPGDVAYAMNGKSIQIDNTDAEGRLILADGLCYAQTFKPEIVVDLATLTGAIIVALHSAATGVFSNDDYLWNILNKAGYATGDRVWRMPLFKHFTKLITKSQLADLNNISTSGPYGGSCLAAAFLQEFIEKDMKWLHLDIAGVMENKDEVPYLCSGMSGRPTRTLVQFLGSLADSFADKK